MSEWLEQFSLYRRFLLRRYERRYWHMSSRLFLACWKAGLVQDAPDRERWAKLAQMEYGR